MTRENKVRDWDFFLARVMLRSAIKKLQSFTTCACCVTRFSLSYAKYGAAGMTYYGSVVQLGFRCPFPRQDVHFVIQADSQAKLNV